MTKLHKGEAYVLRILLGDEVFVQTNPFAHPESGRIVARTFEATPRYRVELENGGFVEVMADAIRSSE